MNDPELYAKYSVGTQFYTMPTTKGLWSLTPTFATTFHEPFYPCWLHRTMQRWILGIYWKRP